jgi:O-antigen/teichoic acid export membrane protein
MREIKTQNSKLVPRVAAAVRKPVVADLAATFGGRLIQMALALAGNVVSARVLGPDDFGRFGLVIATISVCGTLADAGLTYSAIKFIAQYEAQKNAKAHDVARTYLFLRLLTGATIALLGATLSEPIAALALGHAELTPYLQLAFLTLVGLSVSSYPGTVLVALAQFGRYSLAGVLNATITLSGIFLLLIAGRLDLQSLIVWNVVLPVLSTLPAWLLLPKEWLPWRTGERERTASTAGVAKEMFAFGRWIAFSNLGSILVAQGDLVLLGRLANPAIVGVYSVALTLAMRLDTLNQSLFTVMMPRASRLRGSGNIRAYSRRVVTGSLALAVMLGVAALLAQPIIALLYGEQYEGAIGLFFALLIIVLFDLVTSSLFLVAFPLNKPNVLAVADWLRVVVLFTSGWLLIPIYSAFGAVVARGLARVTGTTAALLALGSATRTTSQLEEREDLDQMAREIEQTEWTVGDGHL